MRCLGNIVSATTFLPSAVIAICGLATFGSAEHVLESTVLAKFVLANDALENRYASDTYSLAEMLKARIAKVRKDLPLQR